MCERWRVPGAILSVAHSVTHWTIEILFLFYGGWLEHYQVL